jgi:hypothetical protein
MEEGLPRTQVLLWVAGEQVRALFENVIPAEYRCRLLGSGPPRVQAAHQK